jgi:hypothetical protein
VYARASEAGDAIGTKFEWRLPEERHSLTLGGRARSRGGKRREECMGFMMEGAMEGEAGN